jgi:hypothetical protein
MAKLNKEQIKKVTDFLELVVFLAVKETIDRQGYFSIENENFISSDDEDSGSGYYAGDSDCFSNEVESKYGIQIYKCYQSEEYATDHTIGLELKGSLAEIFSANGIETRFEVWMENGNGEPKQTIYDAKEFKKNLHFPSFHSLEYAHVNDFDGFYGEITKPYLFEILKVG